MAPLFTATWTSRATAHHSADNPFTHGQLATCVHLSFAGVRRFAFGFLLITHVNILHEERGCELRFRQGEQVQSALAAPYW